MWEGLEEGLEWRMRVRDGREIKIDADGVEVDDWDGVGRWGRKWGVWLKVRAAWRWGGNARQQEGCFPQAVRIVLCGGRVKSMRRSKWRF